MLELKITLKMFWNLDNPEQNAFQKICEFLSNKT